MAKRPAAPPRPLLEWTAAAIGLVVTLLALGIVARDALRPQAPPDLVARIVAVDGARLEIEVANRGDRAAAAVEIEARAGARLARATLDHAPGRSTGTVHLLLPPTGPDQPVEVAVLGWQDP
jgi:uncharacterized protein (TIGR02588 family)